MSRIVISGDRIDTLEDIYDEVERQLTLPYFGRNLDALWDVLTREVEGPVEILWREAEASRARLGADFDRLTALLREVAEDRPDVYVTYT
ncbi:MAG: barstar family protein [Rhodospirillales bacterium]|nr:barstar family protein [Rhodospirillales bacterium]